MSDNDAGVAVNVGNIHVDKAVMTNPRPDNRQTLLQMTPLLSVLITGLALVITSGMQWWQTKSNATQKTDEDWRAALDKVSENSDPLVGSLEMQSFLTVDKYRNRAGSIIAVKLPKILDPQEFDAAFVVMPERIAADNQNVLVNVAKAITSDLSDKYTLALDKMPAQKRAASTFSSFIYDPASFGIDGKDLDYLLAETWKLDSTIRGLQAIWTRKSGIARAAPVSPQGTDLTSIEFYGTGKPIDFSGVSFKGADLGGSEFIGACILTDADALKVSHCTTKH